MTSTTATDARRKADAKLQARAALVGVQLLRLPDGTWLARRWGWTKELVDSEVEPWLRRMESAP